MNPYNAGNGGPASVAIAARASEEVDQTCFKHNVTNKASCRRCGMDLQTEALDRITSVLSTIAARLNQINGGANGES
jgi:hypothetical protein